jgi:NADPH:quinone reductase-like Zn-dependent oxidoreductase
MQTEFRAIVHSEYGAPEQVLRIAKRQLTSDEIGFDDVLVKVIARPIHHGDIHILSGLPQGGPVASIPEGTLRIPGFEGVGTILSLGTNAKAAKRLSEGQRVAFFPAAGAWSEYVVVRYNSLLDARLRASSKSFCFSSSVRRNQLIIDTLLSATLFGASE